MNLTWISVIHQFQIRSGFRNNRFYLKGSICFRFIFLRLSLCVCVYLCVCNWSEVWYGPWAHDVRQSNHHSRFVSSYKRTDITEGGKRTYCYWWGPACAIFFTSPSNPLTPPSPPAMDAQNTLYSTRNNCFCLEGVRGGGKGGAHGSLCGEKGVFEGQLVTSPFPPSFLLSLLAASPPISSFPLITLPPYSSFSVFHFSTSPLPPFLTPRVSRSSLSSLSSSPSVDLRMSSVICEAEGEGQ